MSGQQVKKPLVNLDKGGKVFPSPMVLGEFLDAAEAERLRPNESGLDLRPKRYGQFFKATDLEDKSRTEGLDGQDLEGEFTDSIGTNVKLNLIHEGYLCAVIGGEDICTPNLTGGISTHPHIDH